MPASLPHAPDVSVEGPAAASAIALPPPLVRPWRHPLTWTRQHVAMLGVKAVFAYVGILVVAALYYILLETKVTLPFLHETNTQAWHRLVPRTSLRHDIRNVGEGLLGGMLGIAFTYNHFRRRRRINAIDRVEMLLRIPNVKDERKLVWWQVLYGLLLIPLYASVGFFAGEAVVALVHPYVNHALEAQRGSFFFNVKSNLLEDWPRKVIGLAAAFYFGHRPAKAVIDDIQLWFVERRIERGRGLRFYHPPPFKARYNDFLRTETSLQAGARTARGGRARYLITTVIVVLAGADAAYGYYVLNYIAKKHH